MAYRELCHAGMPAFCKLLLHRLPKQIFKRFCPQQIKKKKKVSIVQLQAEIVRNRIDAAKKM